VDDLEDGGEVVRQRVGCRDGLAAGLDSARVLEGIGIDAQATR